jgi:hypothetical protein
LTIWSGVYNNEQADRGAEAYQSNCSPCHGIALDGVARLKGDDFMERWREFDVRSLYEFISMSMPRQRRGSPNRPGSLSEATYTDIITHIFRSNSFPAGAKELNIDEMKNIQIELKDGPMPVPNGALVQLVGCMARRGTEWILTNASEPARTAFSTSSTDEETTQAQKKALSAFQFTMTNIGFLGPTFDPAAHAGQKMHAKGYLTRQTGNNRISVTSLATLSPTCP